MAIKNVLTPFVPWWWTMDRKSQIFIVNFYKGLVLIRLASSTRYLLLSTITKILIDTLLLLRICACLAFDGIRLAKRIREFDTKIKILLITVFYFNEIIDTEEYRQAKLTGLIQKPTKP